MDGRTIMRNLEGQIFWVTDLVFMADFYKEEYGAKYLYTRTRALKIIRCLISAVISATHNRFLLY